MTVLPLSDHQVRQKGRGVPPRYTYTFASSGITIECHKVGPSALESLGRAIRKETQRPDHPHAMPPVPTQEIDYGNDDKRQEELPESAWSDEYKAQRREWQTWVDTEVGKRFARMLICDYVEIDLDAARDEIAHLEKSLKRQGAELPDLDIDTEGYTDDEILKLRYVFMCCMLDPANDGQAFVQYMIGRSQPREEAIQDRIAAFRAT